MTENNPKNRQRDPLNDPEYIKRAEKRSRREANIATLTAFGGIWGFIFLGMFIASGVKQTASDSDSEQANPVILNKINKVYINGAFDTTAPGTMSDTILKQELKQHAQNQTKEK